MESVNVEEVAFKSSNEINIVHGKIYSPSHSARIVGIVQISHGMCEYIEKYENFIEFLVSKGYVVAGNDHIGHGKSVLKDGDRGYFAPENGYKNLIKDLFFMTKVIKKRYPNLPYFLFGHSMGSFIARCYAAEYGEELDGLILCGTIGPQWMIDAGIQFADFIIDKKGPMFKSRRIDHLAFDFANLQFQPIKTRYDWTCSDERVIARRLDDKKSNFIFTAGGYKDLFNLVKLCNDEKFVSNTPKNLPIYMFSGSMDPLAEGGFAIQKVYNMFKRLSVKDVTMKIYDGYRHEMLNEKNKLEVYKDVLDWIEVIRFGVE